MFHNKTNHPASDWEAIADNLSLSNSQTQEKKKKPLKLSSNAQAFTPGQLSTFDPSFQQLEAKQEILKVPEQPVVEKSQSVKEKVIVEEQKVQGKAKSDVRKTGKTSGKELRK